MCSTILLVITIVVCSSLSFVQTTDVNFDKEHKSPDGTTFFASSTKYTLRISSDDFRATVAKVIPPESDLPTKPNTSWWSNWDCNSPVDTMWFICGIAEADCKDKFDNIEALLDSSSEMKIFRYGLYDQESCKVEDWFSLKYIKQKTVEINTTNLDKKNFINIVFEIESRLAKGWIID